jgi:hypothetical protein
MGPKYHSIELSTTNCLQFQDRLYQLQEEETKHKITNKKMQTADFLRLDGLAGTGVKFAKGKLMKVIG